MEWKLALDTTKRARPSNGPKKIQVEAQCGCDISDHYFNQLINYSHFKN